MRQLPASIRLAICCKRGIKKAFGIIVLCGLVLSGNVLASSEFDGIDITNGPLYLTRNFELPGITIDLESLTTNQTTSVYTFNQNNSGLRSVNTGFDVFSENFSWSISSIDGVDQLRLTFNPGVTGFSTSLTTVPFPFEQSNSGVQELADKYGQLVVDQLLTVDLGLLIPAAQIEVQEQVEAIAITRVSAGIWNLSLQFTETLIIPQNVIDAVPGGWQGDTTPTSATQTREEEVTVTRYEGMLFSNLSDTDIEGAWALPMFLNDPGSAPSPPATRFRRFFSEKVEFLANGTAIGTYSGIAFDWVLSGDRLLLTSGNESFSYSLLDENNNVSLLALEYTSSSDPDGFVYVARGGRFRESGLARAQALPVELPTFYQSLISGEPTLIDGVLACEGISGWFFTVPGMARQIFGCRDSTPGSRRFLLNPQSTINITDEEVTYFRSSGFSAQRRFWQILSETNSGLIVAIERFEFVFDQNGNSTFEESESQEGAAPRLIVLKPMDLSLSGEPWDELDADDDGLNSLAEVANGTDFGNPDTDGDQVSDSLDLCQQTDAGDTVDESGCAQSQLDTDNDGLSDDVDLCDDTSPNQQVNAAGCAANQLSSDADGDGIPDSGELELGTSANNPDTDGDGFSDLEELEAGTDPTDSDDSPPQSGLNIILIEAAINGDS